MNISSPKRRTTSSGDVTVSRDNTLAYDWLKGRRFRSLERMIIDEIVNRSGPGSLQYDLERTPLDDKAQKPRSLRNNIRLR